MSPGVSFPCILGGRYFPVPGLGSAGALPSPPPPKKLLTGLRLGKGTVRNEESERLLSQIYFLRHARRRCWNAPNPSHFVVKNDFSSERPCQNANAIRRGSTLTYYHPLSPERSLSAA